MSAVVNFTAAGSCDNRFSYGLVSTHVKVLNWWLSLLSLNLSFCFMFTKYDGCSSENCPHWYRIMIISCYLIYPCCQPHLRIVLFLEFHGSHFLQDRKRGNQRKQFFLISHDIKERTWDVFCWNLTGTCFSPKFDHEVLHQTHNLFISLNSMITQLLKAILKFAVTAANSIFV